MVAKDAVEHDSQNKITSPIFHIESSVNKHTKNIDVVAFNRGIQNWIYISKDSTYD